MFKLRIDLFDQPHPNGDISPARCISCNSCYVSTAIGALYCVVKKKLEKKRLRKEK